MMKQNATNAKLLGMTAAAIGTSGSLPEQNPWNSLNLPSTGTKTRDISTSKLEGQSTLQNFGATSGDEPQTFSTRLASFVKDGEKPEKSVERKPFPRKINGSTEDFDNFEDAESTGLHWKVSGESWADSAALAGSGSAFNRRYSTRSDLQFLGFSGKSFALTANVSTKEQSKAVSDEFTINTDRITFKIAGGANKEQTSFKLVVDDKPVFVATGENDFTFRSGEFPTAKYKGKKGHFEIEDKSSIQSPAGLIAVDDIKGEARFGIGDSYLINSDEMRFALTNITKRASLNSGSKFFSCLNISHGEFEDLRSLINKRVIARDLDFVPGSTVSALGNKIKKAWNEVTKSNDVESASPLGQRLLAEAVCGWVRTHMIYNVGLDPINGVSRDIRKLHWQAETLLKQDKLEGVCAGFSNLTQDLGQAVGLKCYQVSGFVRNKDNTFAQSIDHSLNFFVIKVGENQYCLQADNTRGREAIGHARQAGDIHASPFVLPMTSAEEGYVLWHERLTEYEGKALPDELNIYTISFDEWKQLGTNEILEKIKGFVLRFNEGATSHQFP